MPTDSKLKEPGARRRIGNYKIIKRTRKTARISGFSNNKLILQFLKTHFYDVSVSLKYFIDKKKSLVIDHCFFEILSHLIYLITYPQRWIRLVPISYFHAVPCVFSGCERKRFIETGKQGTLHWRSVNDVSPFTRTIRLRPSVLKHGQQKIWLIFASQCMYFGQFSCQ